MTAELTLLGREAQVPASPDVARLERVPNPEPGATYLVRFACPEFTSLCPVTGQPDFAHLVLDYAPGEWLLESKSLKLFLASFRNHPGFHEACTLLVGRRVVEAVGRDGCGSAATGTRAAASGSTCSGRPGHRPPACGCRTKAWGRTAGGVENEA